MNTAFRAIVVGAGGIADAWFGPLKAEGVEVAAVVDLNKNAAEERIKKYGLSCRAWNDLAAALRETTCDFVVDLTIPAAHCNVTCTALEAGVPVISEKPMADSMAAAQKMVATSQCTGKMYMVSQSRRWDAKHQQLRDAVASGQIGALTTLNCDFYIGAHFGGFRDAMESPIILDMAIHHFDLARYISGADPVSVYAAEFNPKGSWYRGAAAANCIFEMSNGIVFAYRGSWCAEGCHTSWNGDWRIIGETGTLKYERDGDPTGQAVAGESGFNRPLKDVAIPAANMPFGTMHGALREMLDFLRSGKKPQTECHDNIKSLAMVFAAIESSRQGARVEVRW